MRQTAKTFIRPVCSWGLLADMGVPSDVAMIISNLSPVDNEVTYFANYNNIIALIYCNNDNYGSGGAKSSGKCYQN